MIPEWECSSKSNKHCESWPFSTPSLKEKPTFNAWSQYKSPFLSFTIFLKLASKTFYDENNNKKKGNNIMLIVSTVEF